MPDPSLRGPLDRAALIRCLPETKVPLWRSALETPPPLGDWYGLRTGRTGAAAEYWVLDLDVKPAEGVDGVRRFMERFGALPTTYTVRTRGGGLHLYFRLPPSEAEEPSNRVDLLGDRSGVDVRGRGGFVVGPGSPGYFVVDGREPTEAPPWLVALVGRAATAAPVCASVVPPILPGDPRYPAAYAAAKAVTEEHPPAVPGSRDHSLYVLVCKLVEYANLCDSEILAWVQWFNDVRCPVPATDIAEKTPRKITTARETVPLPWGPSEPLPPEGISADPERVPVARPVVGPEDVGEAPRPDLTKDGQLKLRAALPHEIRNAIAYDARWQAGKWVWDEVHGGPFFRGTPPIPLECLAGERADKDVKIWGASGADVFSVRAFLGESYGFRANPADVASAIVEVARKTPYNPLREYLSGLRDRTYLPPLDLRAWATELMGLEHAIEAEAVEKWLVAAVARGMRPGEDVHQVLILRGLQSQRKSKFFQHMFGAQWVKDSPISDFTSRDAVISLRGFWCVEFAEMQSVLRQDYEVVKGYLTQSHDDYRVVGGGDLIRGLRCCVFGGTTNETSILKDPTGSRRLWPVHVTRKIDPARIDADRDRVWRAAVALYDAGTRWYWEEEPEEYAVLKAELETVDPWAPYVAQYLITCGRSFVSTNEILEQAIYHVLPSARDRLDSRTASRVARILQRLGMAEQRISRTDRRRRWVVTPEGLNACSRIWSSEDKTPDLPASMGKLAGEVLRLIPGGG